ncbi:MAG TPA: cytochrome c oxidase subunit I [Actinomycetota bacterium]|nr:cytochrome c oxidase subunit I [Actinomycetota bacterium]
MATVHDATSSSSPSLEEMWGEPQGLGSWLSTVDHKRIGMKYLVTAMVFLVAGGVESLIMRAQLAQPNLHLISPEVYNQLFTMHGVTMMFLFATPVLSGFGNYLVPLMIGARDMAFPRLNAFGYWVFLASGIFLYSAFLTGHVPDAGWFNYVPLSGPRFAPGINIDFYALGLIFVAISTTAGAINFIVTILKMRAPGMSINRIPIFVWGELAMSFSIVFALPTLTVACVLLELERKFGFHFFDAGHGGDPLLWQHLFWIFGHPEVYIIILPALGMVSALIPTFTGRRMVGYIWIVIAEMATALIGFGVWTHHMFTTGLPQVAISFVALSSFFIAIPSGVQIFAWIATLIAGRPRLKTPMLFVLGFLLVFVIGGLSGVMFAAVPFDQQVHDSYFVIAHFHYVMVGGLLFPLFGALYYWLPKMTGRMMGEGLGKWSFWTMFAGFNVCFFPMHVMGILGQPRRTYTYQAGLGWTGPNLISTIGAFLLGLGIALTFWNWVWSRWHGAPAGNDPWGGDTLEWATTSPPPEYNFETIPTVASLEPTWDQPNLRDGAQPPEAGGRPLLGGHLTLSTSLLDGTPRAVVFMPHATLAPVIASLGLLVGFWGVVFGAWLLAGVGATVFAGGMIDWFWPRHQTQET